MVATQLAAATDFLPSLDPQLPDVEVARPTASLRLDDDESDGDEANNNGGGFGGSDAGAVFGGSSSFADDGELAFGLDVDDDGGAGDDGDVDGGGGLGGRDGGGGQDQGSTLQHQPSAFSASSFSSSTSPFSSSSPAPSGRRPPPGRRRRVVLAHHDDDDDDVDVDGDDDADQEDLAAAAAHSLSTAPSASSRRSLRSSKPVPMTLNAPAAGSSAPRHHPHHHHRPSSSVAAGAHAAATMGGLSLPVPPAVGGVATSATTSGGAPASSSVATGSSFVSSASSVGRRRLGSLLAEAKRALRGGTAPKLVEDGVGGTYFMYGRDGRVTGVFKPRDEEAYNVNNPKGYSRPRTDSKVVGATFKEGVLIGEAAVREVAAYLLDHDNFAAVPETELVVVNAPGFHAGDVSQSLPAALNSRKAPLGDSDEGMPQQQQPFLSPHHHHQQQQNTQQQVAPAPGGPAATAAAAAAAAAVAATEAAAAAARAAAAVGASFVDDAILDDGGSVPGQQEGVRKTDEGEKEVDGLIGAGAGAGAKAAAATSTRVPPANDSHSSSTLVAPVPTSPFTSAGLLASSGSTFGFSVSAATIAAGDDDDEDDVHGDDDDDDADASSSRSDDDHDDDGEDVALLDSDDEELSIPIRGGMGRSGGGKGGGGRRRDPPGDGASAAFSASSIASTSAQPRTPRSPTHRPRLVAGHARSALSASLMGASAELAGGAGTEAPTPPSPTAPTAQQQQNAGYGQPTPWRSPRAAAAAAAAAATTAASLSAAAMNKPVSASAPSGRHQHTLLGFQVSGGVGDGLDVSDDDDSDEDEDDDDGDDGVSLRPGGGARRPRGALGASGSVAPVAAGLEPAAGVGGAQSRRRPSPRPRMETSRGFELAPNGTAGGHHVGGTAGGAAAGAAAAEDGGNAGRAGHHAGAATGATVVGTAAPTVTSAGARVALVVSIGGGDAEPLRRGDSRADSVARRQRDDTVGGTDDPPSGAATSSQAASASSSGVGATASDAEKKSAPVPSSTPWRPRFLRGKAGATPGGGAHATHRPVRSAPRVTTTPASPATRGVGVDSVFSTPTNGPNAARRSGASASSSASSSSAAASSSSRSPMSVAAASAAARSLERSPGSPYQRKIGSFQEFVEHDADCEEVPPPVVAQFPDEEVHKIALLDLRLFNTDRHGGNVLYRELPAGTLVQAPGAAAPVPLAAPSYVLVPIDHGYAIPSTLGETYFEWHRWPQADRPFCEAHRQYIQQRVDGDADVALLRAEFRGEAFRPQHFFVIRLGALVLRLGVLTHNLTARDLADFVCRAPPTEPSPLEKLVERARHAATVAARLTRHTRRASTSNAGDDDDDVDDAAYRRPRPADFAQHTHSEARCGGDCPVDRALLDQLTPLVDEHFARVARDRAHRHQPQQTQPLQPKLQLQQPPPQQQQQQRHTESRADLTRARDDVFDLDGFDDM